MDRFSDYLAMGGHALFIWPALGITAAVLIGILVSSLWAARSQARAMADLEAVLGDPAQRRRHRRAAAASTESFHAAPAHEAPAHEA